VHGQVTAGHVASKIITDYHKTKHFHWWNVLDDMCRMGRWSFLSWFNVDAVLTKICAKNDFYIFVPS